MAAEDCEQVLDSWFLQMCSGGWKSMRQLYLGAVSWDHIAEGISNPRAPQWLGDLSRVLRVLTAIWQFSEGFVKCLSFHRHCPLTLYTLSVAPCEQQSPPFLQGKTRQTSSQNITVLLEASIFYTCSVMHGACDTVCIHYVFVEQ